MYSVPVVPPDLRHEETIIQAANALDCLQKTINSVFDRIDIRTQRNNAKVQELTERIEKAQARIRGLVGTKRAIKIYAPARFPATQLFRDIPKTFDSGIVVSPLQPVNMNKEKSIRSYEVQSRVDAPSTQALQEKLVFFHVRPKESDGMINSSMPPIQPYSRLGTVPQDLRSTNSLLLFNSDELVYGAEYSDKESWKRAKLFKNSKQRLHGAPGLAQKQPLEPAPHSLANRNQKMVYASGLRYTPKLNEAPEINLPLDLPDLPGIADDIHFEGQDQQQIAPSLFIENLPDLPELEQAVKNEEYEKNAVTDNIPELADATPPPPPPPPPASSATPTATAMQISAPPPPPPPPQPVFARSAPSTTVAPLQTSDTRSELMDAIRKAGGAQGGRLRATLAAAPIDVVDIPGAGGSGNSSAQMKPSTRGDLMADLHNKLLMRRKGISGAKDTSRSESGTTLPTPTSGNPVISRLSALIPPPAARKQSDDDDDNDEDNDTDWAE